MSIMTRHCQTHGIVDITLKFLPGSGIRYHETTHVDLDTTCGIFFCKCSGSGLLQSSGGDVRYSHTSLDLAPVSRFSRLSFSLSIRLSCKKTTCNVKRVEKHLQTMSAFGLQKMFGLKTNKDISLELPLCLFFQDILPIY